MSSSLPTWNNAGGSEPDVDHQTRHLAVRKQRQHSLRGFHKEPLTLCPNPIPPHPCRIPYLIYGADGGHPQGVEQDCAGGLSQHATGGLGRLRLCRKPKRGREGVIRFMPYGQGWTVQLGGGPTFGVAQWLGNDDRLTGGVHLQAAGQEQRFLVPS